MVFDRWKSHDDYSHAFRIFSGYHTYMNDMYWSYAPIFHFSQHIYRNETKVDPKLTTYQIFKIHSSSKDGRRVISDADQWSKNNKEFDNWTRLNALVAINSYFEIYLSTIVSLAIESDLGLLYSVPHEIDGIKVLKIGKSNDYSFFDISEKLTKGTWDSRISNYKQYFGFIPSELESNKTDLEQIRVLRNKVTHSFGRDIDLARDRKTKYTLDIERLSLQRLQKYMGMIRVVAKSIDAHLLGTHIGDFENIHYYHTIKDTLPDVAHNRNFKEKLNSLDVKQKGWEYINSLIDYYNSL